MLSEAVRMGNSWQSPVTGEPSLGTMHLHPGTILDTDPASTSVQTLDISAFVPVGTKLVRGWGTFVSATAGRTIQIVNAGATEVYAKSYSVAGATKDFSWEGAVDANRNIYWVVSNTDVSALLLYLVEYSI